ncbi:hypothetical protein BMI91_19575 [Thioclava sediminum]|uniref:SLATT domain-containing protein n=1 Tax=Thioclava sediminum TaxID=1915319 RepID=A0ABX3MS14_9RHOB|nr:hypothetical protein [Thioclava sediminum]OOY22484.1 hypothetical protein BMI91_19575 [Thioclava sediminum]
MNAPDFSTAYDLAKWGIGIGMSLAIAVVGMVIKAHSKQISDTKTDIERSRKEHSDFRVEVARDYVSNEQFSRLEDRMDKRFDKLEELIVGVAK